MKLFQINFFKLLVLFLELFTFFDLSAKHNFKIDSLKEELRKWENKKGYKVDTIIFKIFYELGINYRNINIDSSIFYFLKSKNKANEIKDIIKEIDAFKEIGWCYHLKGEDKKSLNIYDSILNTLIRLPKNEKIIKIESTIYGQIGTIYYSQNNNDKALEYYIKALNVNEKINYLEGQAIMNINIGNVYKNKGNFYKSLEYYLKALKISEKIGDKKILAANLVNIGLIYKNQGVLNKALEYYFRALSIYEEINSIQGQSMALINIGTIYSIQNEYDKALEYYFKALKLVEEMNNKQLLASILGNIGILYKKLGQLNKALESQEKALKIYKEINDKLGEANTLGNIGNIYFEQKKYSISLNFFKKSLDIYKNLNYKQGIAIKLGNIGEVYFKLKNYKSAEKYLKEAIKLCQEINLPYELMEQNKILSEIYVSKGDYKSAYKTFLKYTSIKDTLMKEESKRIGLIKDMQYKFEKQQAEERALYEKKIALAESEKKRQQIILTFIMIGLFLTILFSFIIYNSLQKTKKQKEIIETIKNEITIKKNLLEQKNNEIFSSLRYARQIQNFILPSKTLWEKFFPESFIFYMPRDIVGGDFYWLVELEDYIFLALADCTGHGIPGTLISITCYNALNKTTIEEKILNTNEILDRTREIIIKQFHSDQVQLNDGMDIALIRFNKKNQKNIQYSGANIPLIIINNGILKEIKPDKQPIGYSEKLEPFKVHNFNLAPDSYIYLYTDGYVDQFGGPKNKKIGKKNLKNLLLLNYKKSMKEQLIFFENYFFQWKENEPQIDDISFIGIKIS